MGTFSIFQIKHFLMYMEKRDIPVIFIHLQHVFLNRARFFILTWEAKCDQCTKLDNGSRALKN